MDDSITPTEVGLRHEIRDLFAQIRAETLESLDAEALKPSRTSTVVMITSATGCYALSSR